MPPILDGFKKLSGGEVKGREDNRYIVEDAIIDLDEVFTAAIDTAPEMRRMIIEEFERVYEHRPDIGRSMFDRTPIRDLSRRWPMAYSLYLGRPNPSEPDSVQLMSGDFGEADGLDPNYYEDDDL